MSSNTPRRRLYQLAKELEPSTASIGKLKLGTIEFEVPASATPSRLPRSEELLDVRSNSESLRWMLQKYILGQDIFLSSAPGPFARRLALSFASLINSEYEYIALHRDVGETELKQGREIRPGGTLAYVDSPAVNAVKHGRILILEGIEKAERGIMPVLNNLLENREMNLEDGTHIIHPHRYALLDDMGSTTFIPAHKNFRVIAIAAPVPPYPGFPLDPPFRSRFQSRYVDPLGSLISLSTTVPTPSCPIATKLREVILTTQFASESRSSIGAIAKSDLPPFPQTALLKLYTILSKFPPPAELSSGQLARLVLTIHPALIHAPFEAWALLSRQMEDAGLGELGAPSMASSNESIGMLGYRLVKVERVDERSATATFEGAGQSIQLVVPAGPRPLRVFPFVGDLEFHATERFMGLLTAFVQAHALGWDISYIPPALPSTASSSTSTLVNVFTEVLGYEAEAVHMYKEIGGRELVMRRQIQEGGATVWKPSPLVEGALNGRVVHLAGLDVITGTAGSLARLIQDRELELWEGKRIVARATDEELTSGELSVSHPSFRVISTASKTLPLKDWLSEEHANMFFTIPSQPMDSQEEADVLLATGCAPSSVYKLLAFAEKYRQSMTQDSVQKNRKLGTRSLVRIANRLAKFPEDVDDLHVVLCRSILAEFLPTVERMSLDSLLEEADIQKKTPAFHPSPVVQDGCIFFAGPTSADGQLHGSTVIPLYDVNRDVDGKSLVPHMDSFYDNSLQTGLMRDLAVDMELLGEHLVLLGNQGVGKNKIVDRLCQLMRRPREYIQLHRDTTVNQLMFTTSLEGGVIRYHDSPLLRAIATGRVIIIDEADKAPEHVVAVFRSIAGQSEMTLSDGRRVRSVAERPGDIAVHPDFRLILLANRPGYPFLGNHFLQVLGDNFSCHSVSNPDEESERRLLAQLAPEMDELLLRRLVAAFQDLRRGYESGFLSYPYSLRELINLVKHMQAYPDDTLSSTLRNIFDFDVHKQETIDYLSEVLNHHGLKVEHLGLEGAREAAKKEVLDVAFEPTGSTDLDTPKEGKHDPNNDPHEGGNTWAAGTRGRDTAGLGGRGGYKRLFTGNNIKQISDKLKDEVSEHIREKAREMARKELERKLDELDMSAGEAKGYSDVLKSIQGHILSLHDLLENLSAKEEERVWVRRQTDGELDDSRLTEGLTGEAAVYKRRGMEKPELGRPQIKPKRIRFVFDISGSMYRFQYDGRLQRSLETAAMLMETFDRLSRKDKYVWDMYGHSGDGPLIPLVEADKPTADVRDRWKVLEKMTMITQYAFSGDYTVEAIEKGVTAVEKFDADDWIVIALTDANFGRYNITAEDLKRSMKNPKVHTALICIGEGAESSWVTKSLPGRAFRVKDTADIPRILRGILSTLIDR